MAESSNAVDIQYNKNQRQTSAEDLDFGRRAVNCKFITTDQLNEALARQRKEEASGSVKSLEAILLETGIIDWDQIVRLKKAKEFYEIRKKSLQFGTITVENGFARQEDINRALAEQVEAFQKKMSGRMLGDILIQNGVITAEEKEWILNEQKRLEKEARASIAAEIAGLDNEGDPVDLEQKLQAAFKAFREREQQFALIAVKNGYASQAEVDKALAEQQLLFEKEQLQKLIGDILIEAEVMQPEQRDAILQSQNRLDEKTTDASVNDLSKHLEVIISDDSLEVYLHAKESIPQSITPKDIRSFLKNNKIIYGITDDAAIEKYLKGIGQTYKFKVAEGKPADPGRDATIKYHFKTAADGIGSRTSVKDGDVIAEMISMQRGTPGMDVYGRTIPVGKNRQLNLQYGSGTHLSEDRLKVLASIDGQPKISIEGVVGVYPEQRFEGDLNFKNDEAAHQGNLVVNGVIQSSARIICGSIKAREIRGAQIEAVGDVHVSGGIIGATITAQGNIQAKFVNKCEIETFGNIIVENEIIDSQIACSDTCKVKRGKILSSVIAAKKGLMVVDIGSPVTEPCQIKIGVDENIERRVNKLDKKLADLSEDLEESRSEELSLLYDQKKVKQEMLNTRQYGDRLSMARKSVKEEALRMKEMGKDSQFATLNESLVKLEEKFETVKSSLNTLSQRQTAIQEKSKTIRRQIEKTQSIINVHLNLKDAYIDWSQREKSLPVLRAKGQIFEDTVLSGEHATLILKQSYKNVHINEIKQTNTNSPDEAYEFKISHR